ncbi:hypothetical protein TB2_040767 [Malus domestica]
MPARPMTNLGNEQDEQTNGGDLEVCGFMNDKQHYEVICLDEYHSLDMTWRKKKGVTMLDPRANDLDLMYKQMKAIKEGKAVEKPVQQCFWSLGSS